MKLVYRSLLAIALIVGTGQEPASAQFLKNLFGGKDKNKSTKKPPAKPATIKPATTVTPKKSATPPKPKPFAYPPTVRKNRYRVDVLVQLYLDELVQGNKSVYKVRLPEKALPGMNFYEGVKLATDTLKDYYNLDIYIHDVTTAGKRPQDLIAHGTLDSSDLVIAALPSALLPTVANYAKKRSVNFVSALSPADADVKNNPYFTLLQPTLQTHCEWIAAAVSRKHRGKKPLLLYRPDVQVSANARRYLMGDDSAGYVSMSAAEALRGGTLTSFLDRNGTNVIISTVLEDDYADSLLQKISRNYPEYSFEVYGMPTWKSIASIRKADAYPNMAINFTAPFYFDASTASGQSVAKAYQRLFGGKPGDMVYRGFETIHWYAYLLDRYGTVFNSHMADAGSAGFTRFEVKPRYDKDADLLYNENRHLYLYRYSGGNFSVD